MNLPVIVAAYNRPASLSRLLRSLDNAHYSRQTELIISIDKSDNNEVLQFAKNFNWKHGKKTIIAREKHLGLKDHILACGDLAMEFDGIILLEDDLFVSPAFYDFALQAFKFYEDEKELAGISLYSHSYNETAQLPFYPLFDDSDVFFMQVPSSWGQCWSKKQWAEFRKWYDINRDSPLQPESGVPANVVNWPDSSWKKYFFMFMIHANKYFVYPRYSLSTNFGDLGVHFDKKYSFQQTPILTETRPFNFKRLISSSAVYDSLCEILPDCLKKKADFLNHYKFDVDLYGIKEPHRLQSPYILTTRHCSNPIFSYSMELIPMELNITYAIKGSTIYFAKTKNCSFKGNTSQIDDYKLYYFYRVPEFQLNNIIESSEKMRVNNESLAMYEKTLKEKNDIIFRNTELLKKKDETLIRQTIAIKEKDNIIEERDTLIEQLRKKVQEREVVLNEYRESLKLKDRLLKEMEENTATINKLAQQKEKELSDMKMQLSSLSATISQKDTLIGALIEAEKQKDIQLRKKDDVIQEQIEHLKNTQQQLELKNEKVEALLTEILAKDREIQQLISSNNMKESALGELKTSFETLKEDIEVYKRTVKDSEAEKEKMRQTLLANQAEKEQYHTELQRQWKAIQEKDLLIEALRINIQEKEKLFNQVISSYSFKIGKIIVSPASKVKAWLNKK